MTGGLNWRGIVVLIVVALLAGPRTASAQFNLFYKAKLSEPQDCPDQFNPAPASPGKLLACVNALAQDLGVEERNGTRAFQRPTILPTLTRQHQGQRLHEDLLTKYATYLKARELVMTGLRAAPANPDLRSARSKVEASARAIHAELQAHRLEDTALVVGEFRAGAVLTDSGSVTGTSAGTTSGNQSALAHIVWETTHAGAADTPQGHDWALAGQFGLQPALSLLQSTAGTAARLDTTFQQALVIDVGLKASGFSGRTERSLVLRGGFVRFGDLGQIVERNGISYLALPAANGDRVAPYVEVGGSVGLYDRPMSVVHLAMGTLSPRLTGEVVYRRDTRFNLSGTQIALSNPEDRFVVRFMLDGLDVVDKRTAPESNKTFKVGFGFEYQRGTGSGVPYGFSFLIRGAADLLRILQGDHVDTVQ